MTTKLTSIYPFTICSKIQFIDKCIKIIVITNYKTYTFYGHIVNKVIPDYFNIDESCKEEYYKLSTKNRTEIYLKVMNELKKNV